MRQPVDTESRRRFIRSAAAGAVVLPIAGSLLRPEFAMSGEAGHLDEADPTAKSLGYTEDIRRQGFRAHARLVRRLRRPIGVDPPAEFGQQFPLKCRMALQPGRVAWRRVWQRKVCRAIFPPCLDGFGHGRLAAFAEKVTLGVLPDEQGQLDHRQPGEQMTEPQARAFASRRQVAAVAAAGIAVAHRNDGNARFIVEEVAGDAHPRPQPHSARIVPGNAGGVHTQARRLADDEDPGRWCGTQYRARTERKLLFARPASAHGGQQLVKRRITRSVQGNS